MPRLILTDGTETYTFEIGKVFRIGRHPDNDLPLKESQVSRWHAEVRREEDHHRLVDLDSLNGTYVNGEKAQNWRLKHGDRVRIGRCNLVWQEDVVPEEKTPAPVPFAKEDIVKKVRDLNLEELASIKKEGTPPAYASAPERMYLLFQVARALNTSDSLDEFLKTTLDLTLASLGAGRGAILLDERGQLRPHIQRSMDGKLESEVPISSTITSRVISEGLSVLTSDAHLDPRFATGDSIAGYNIRSVLCVPLWEADHTRGVLYVDNCAKSRAFTEQDMDLVTAIAHHVALGIRHHELEEKSKSEALLRHQLERYHSPDMVDLLLKQPFDKQREDMMAQERQVTILFCDIVEFSTLARRLRPAETANLLSHFFDEMTTVIFRHMGSVNKFMGDAILALWGAPFSYGNDEERAVTCAADMIRSLYRLLKTIDPAKWFKVRIGINTGEVIAGNIGSTNMLEYTVIGEPVNTAARIQELAQPNQVLIGENTRKALGSKFPTLDLGYVQLRGAQQNIKVYELIWREISSVIAPNDPQNTDVSEP